MRRTLAGAAHWMRKLGWRLFRPTTVGVRALVTDDGGRVLLVRHSYTDGWYLPGGGVARGESIIDGLRRELMEEVGIELLGPPRLLGMYSSTLEGKSDHIGVFVVNEWRRAPRSSPEVSATEFVDASKPPADTSAATQRRLAEARGDRPIDFAW